MPPSVPPCSVKEDKVMTFPQAMLAKSNHKKWVDGVHYKKTSNQMPQCYDLIPRPYKKCFIQKEQKHTKRSLNLFVSEQGGGPVCSHLLSMLVALQKRKKVRMQKEKKNWTIIEYNSALYGAALLQSYLCCWIKNCWYKQEQQQQQTNNNQPYLWGTA